MVFINVVNDVVLTPVVISMCELMSNDRSYSSIVQGPTRDPRTIMAAELDNALVLFNTLISKQYPQSVHAYSIATEL